VEDGLLGIAVDPRWPARPYVYVHYTAASSYNIKVVRYALAGDLAGTGDGRLTLDPASRREILPDLPNDSVEHNGGTLLFGPDGMLFVALGDDRVSCAAQDIHQLRGKILRLRVAGVADGGGPGPAYATLDPLDNPFSGDEDPRARLVWQYGLRNPWSFDIDRQSKQVAIADVGNARFEEVDVTLAAGPELRLAVLRRSGRIPVHL
jgi:glucose/arabinose dehydrogenase